MRLIALFLLCATVAGAQERHRFYDGFAKGQLVAEGGLMTFDVAQTCHALENPQIMHLGGAPVVLAYREENLPVKSCAGVAAFNLAVFGAGEGLSYLLHRKHLHWMERAPRFYVMGWNLTGIAYSKKHHAW